ncbi:TIGR02679 domain-containing protein [Streptomyces nogalater]
MRAAVRRPESTADATALVRAQSVLERHTAGAYDVTVTVEDDLHVVELTDASGRRHVADAAADLRERRDRGRSALTERERTAFSAFVLGGMAEELRNRIQEAERLIEAMNESLLPIKTSHGIGVQVRWRLADSANEHVMRIKKLMQRDVRVLRDEESEELITRLKALVDVAHSNDPQAGYATHLRTALDYRAWHVVDAYITGPGPKQERKISRRAKLSQGETRFVSYVTLFAAADAYLSGLPDTGRALRLILLDDAFAKVDHRTIGELMALLVRMDLDFVMTGHALWGSSRRFPRWMPTRSGEPRALPPSPRTSTGTAIPAICAPRHEHKRRPSPARPHPQLPRRPQPHQPVGAARQRLERNRLAPTGTVQVQLDTEGANRLGLLGTRLAPGLRRIQLGALDAALRASAAQCGLVSVVADLTGQPLHDRASAKEAQQTAWTALWQQLDADLTRAGLNHAAWVPDWLTELRSTGVLTRAGVDAAAIALSSTVRVFTALTHTPLNPANGAEPNAAKQWELGELAAHTTGDAHGLDEGRLAGLLVLKAIATACGMLQADSTAGRRALWERVGVSMDSLSGTVLVWGWLRRENIPGHG